MTPDPSSIATLQQYYTAGGPVAAVVAEVRRRIDDHADPALFIGSLAPDLDERAAGLDAIDDRSAYPLFGVPFVVKDNIDVAGLPTTAACPGFAQTPVATAEAVALLLAAGALFVGKVNMDQFATGLVGTRSPYGTPRNVLDPDAVPGGSSSGSAVAVAAGLVAFSLGTDTAGSGRVPAVMNQVVGLKPTRGVVSTVGVVPACASLDCVSVFAGTVADAWQVFEVLDHPADDPWRREDRPARPIVRPDRTRVGVPDARVLREVDADIVESFRGVVRSLEERGARVVEVDLEPFLEAGRRLYGGAFVAERHAAVGEFVDKHPDEVVEPTRTIIAGGAGYSAEEYHAVQRDVHELRATTGATWESIDVLICPSVPDVPSLDAVAAEPIEVNARLGRFTTFANLLDLAALTIPDAGASARQPGLGATLYGPAGADARLAALAGVLLGETDRIPVATPGCTDVVVVGAHLEGEPLNHQLTERGAALVTATTTAPCYRLWALPDGRRPALERVDAGGAAIAVEVWSIPTTELGSFVAEVTPPLAIGTVELDDGTSRLGFVCETGGLAGAADVTAAGGWRAHRTRSG